MNILPSDQWLKLGQLPVPAVPQSVLAAPVITGGGHHHSAVSTEPEEFWFCRNHSPISTLNGPSAEKYFQSLGLPKFEYISATFMMITGPVPWHTDSARINTINIALQNSDTATTEWDNGTGYVMQDGDVYCLDVSNRHRVVFAQEPVRPRIVLSIGLVHGFHSAESHLIFNNIARRLIQQ